MQGQKFAYFGQLYREILHRWYQLICAWTNSHSDQKCNVPHLRNEPLKTKSQLWRVQLKNYKQFVRRYRMTPFLHNLYCLNVICMNSMFDIEIIMCSHLSILVRFFVLSQKYPVILIVIFISIALEQIFEHVAQNWIVGALIET